jgi:hypothetical protein
MHEIVQMLLPDAEIVRTRFPRIVVRTHATPKQVFDAEIRLRRETGEKWEIMMPDMVDKSPIRVKLAAKRTP